MIQGVGVHGDGWNPQVDELAARFRILTFDNRGMGASQPLGGELSIEAMADDAVALMDAENFSDAHVVGHSVGGLVALALALRAPERVRSLALLCTFADGRDAMKLSGRLLWLGLRSRIGTRRMRRRAFLEIVMPPAALAGVDRDALAERLAPLFGHDLADQPSVAMKQLRAAARFDATPRLGELRRIPTLVVSAAHDPISRPMCSRALEAGIPGSRHVALADASHGVPIHDAARINALLAEHWTAAARR